MSFKEKTLLPAVTFFVAPRHPEQENWSPDLWAQAQVSLGFHQWPWWYTSSSPVWLHLCFWGFQVNLVMDPSHVASMSRCLSQWGTPLLWHYVVTRTDKCQGVGLVILIVSVAVWILESEWNLDLSLRFLLMQIECREDQCQLLARYCSNFPLQSSRVCNYKACVFNLYFEVWYDSTMIHIFIQVYYTQTLC